MKVQRRLPNSVLRLSNVVAEHVRYLWFPYIPLGKLTVVEGDPGIGKSWLSLTIAVATATGHGLPGMKKRKPQPVLLLTAEDGLGDTVRPRLDRLLATHDDAANVLSRICALDKAIVFDDAGIATLIEVIRATHPTLVIIDPFVAYVGSIDMHRANETRTVMKKLARIAGDYHCAILVIRHLTKGTKDKSIYRGQGSIDITASARSVLLVGVDPTDADSAAIVHIKCSLAKKGSTQGYTLAGGRFQWTGESSLTPGQLFAAERDTGTSAEVSGWLRAELANGPVRSKDLRGHAKKDGIAWRTIERVKRSLHVQSFAEHTGKSHKTIWKWRLPAR